LAGALAAGGHRLILYTPSNLPPGFKPGHLEIRAPLSSPELVRRLHEEADLLLLLTSFEPGLMEVIRTQFPSKMVDYTAAAVPILVVAPEQSGIADYLQERPTSAQLVCDPSPDAVRVAVNTLAADPAKMISLARGAAAAGEEDFGCRQAYARFCHAMGQGVRR
jgi:glycosyltransferase involved in cell wall biosynthesis